MNQATTSIPSWEAPSTPEPVAAQPAPLPQGITLTPGQEAAMQAYVEFLMDSKESVFVLRGYSGTGKTTLVKTMLERLPGIMKAAKLINIDLAKYAIELTATTNKAAENFAHLSKQHVGTIQSFLGLRVQTDYVTMEPKLVPSKKATIQEQLILFIDEASYIDPELLGYIFRFTNNCKIIFIGDPAQLTPVKCSSTPVFDAKFKGAELTEVVRQAGGNPITDLAAKFRHQVNTGEMFSFTPDGIHIQYLDRNAFDAKIVEEFSRQDWGYHDSKFLAWTNQCVINYNHAIRDSVKGSPHFQVGDYAVCNSYVAGKGRAGGVKTDQMVLIQDIGVPTVCSGVHGKYFTLDAGVFFAPDHLDQWQRAVKAFHAEGEYEMLQEIEATFIDLRAAYACTINKSQGSTFDRVFIDLDDVRKCRNPNLLARMLYVAVSRARHQVFLTGDIY